MNDMDTTDALQGKTVLVTGAGGGIGSALVTAFLAAGVAQVLAAGRSPVDARDRVRFLPLDLTSEQAVAEAAQAAGPVDIVVNNSGVNANQRLHGLDPVQAALEMDVNYFGLLRMYRAFAPAMQKRGSGCFVNMLTVLAHASLPTMATYCASKAAALSLSQAMRAELAPHGVRVMAVLPAAVDTRMSAHAPQPKLAPVELARAVVDALRSGADDVYPGAAANLRASLQADWKAVERMLAGRLPPAPAA